MQLFGMNFAPSADTPSSSGTVVYLHPKIGEILGSDGKLPANIITGFTELNGTLKVLYRSLHLKIQLSGMSGVQYSPGCNYPSYSISRYG